MASEGPRGEPGREDGAPGQEIEALLLEVRSKEGVLRRQEAKLAQLDAHMKTLVTMLAGHRVSELHPVPLKYTALDGPIAVEDRYPLYVLNLGPTSGPQMMHGYKVMRRFVPHAGSRTKRSEVFYTSVMLGWGEQRYYVIRDDENNLWKGVNAFEHFRQAFPGPLPFADVRDWLGLAHPGIRRHFAPDGGAGPGQEPPARKATLNDYFGLQN